MELQIMAGGGRSPVLNPLCFLDHLQIFFCGCVLSVYLVVLTTGAILGKSDPDSKAQAGLAGVMKIMLASAHV